VVEETTSAEGRRNQDTAKEPEMKMGKVLGIAAILLTLAAAANAGVYTYQPSDGGFDNDLDDLSHGYAYEWGIDVSDIPGGEVITGASIFFNNIQNWNSGSYDLYVTLLPDYSGTPPGVTVYDDDNAAGNYFGGWTGALELVYYTEPGGGGDIEGALYPGGDVTYNFDAAEVLALTNAVADDDGALGFDPDCHFWNCGISLTIETETRPPTIVPEPTGLSLLGLAALALRRRRS